MRLAKYSVGLALIAMCVSLSAFAKDKNEGKFTLSSPAQVGSTQLQPGDYKATWDGSGSEVQVKILREKKLWPQLLPSWFRINSRLPTVL